ncbi:uncharacterized protein LOC129255819 [Lytechinus pictus]|uniref:uncharacterized protein LOC129255819 n=1 Tax=Lytechinus pictus TaxID=7653 RepID=UPI0030B9E826
MALSVMGGCQATLFVIKAMELVIALILTMSTLLLILSRPRLRKQHYIFPFNLTLADLTGVLAYAFIEIMRYHNQGIIYATDLLALPSILVMTVIVSNMSILLVAIYQLITIRIDPFGVKNIITTPRCIITCAVTWFIVAGLGIAVYRFSYQYDIMYSCIIVVSLVATSICYIFIYRSVARVESNGNIQLEERKKENQRVLRTFCMVMGTTVLFMLYPVGFGLCRYLIHYTLPLELHFCIVYIQETMVITNYIANSLIYWWRLKDFRSVITTFIKGCNTSGTHVIEM